MLTMVLPSNRRRMRWLIFVILPVLCANIRAHYIATIIIINISFLTNFSPQQKERRIGYQLLQRINPLGLVQLIPLSCRCRLQVISNCISCFVDGRCWRQSQRWIRVKRNAQRVTDSLWLANTYVDVNRLDSVTTTTNSSQAYLLQEKKETTCFMKPCYFTLVKLACYDWFEMSW